MTCVVNKGDIQGMRMRKKPWADALIAQRSDCVITDPALLKGQWHQLAAGLLHVEIGSGKGGYWLAMGHLYPAESWVAIEKVRDAAAIGLKKGGNDITPNMKLIIGDGANISEWFEEGEVDCLHLNFSDPWPKKGHTKRRLTYHSFLENYARILNPKGRLIMKTDNLALFDFSIDSMLEAGWTLLDENRNWRSQPQPQDAITEYEQNFMNLNQPIYRAVWCYQRKETAQ